MKSMMPQIKMLLLVFMVQITRSFKYKTKITQNTLDDNSILDTKVLAPLKYLSNFWRSLYLPVIICEIELDLRWTMYWIM